MRGDFESHSFEDSDVSGLMHCVQHHGVTTSFPADSFEVPDNRCGNTATPEIRMNSKAKKREPVQTDLILNGADNSFFHHRDHAVKIQVDGRPAPYRQLRRPVHFPKIRCSQAINLGNFEFIARKSLPHH